MLKNILTIVVRRFKSNILFTSINLVGLVLGLSCCLLIFIYVKSEYGYDRFHQHFDRLYRLTLTVTDPEGKAPEYATGNSVFPIGPAVKREVPGVEDFVRITEDYQPAVIKAGDNAFFQRIMYADERFFTFFSFPLLHGDPGSVLAHPGNAVVSEELARRCFGSTDIVGRTIAVQIRDTMRTFQVAGVAKKEPQQSSIRFELLLPMHVYEAHLFRAGQFAWINPQVNTFVRLAAGVDPNAMPGRLKDVVDKHAGEQIANIAKHSGQRVGHAYHLQPLRDVHLNAAIHESSVFKLNDPSSYWYAYILTGLALFILVIACFNFINLSVAQSLGRAKEVGIRKTIGSSRMQLIKQFLAESFVICALASGLAVLIAVLALAPFNRITGKQFSVLVFADPVLIAGWAVLLIITTLAAGVYPAWIASGFQPVQALIKKQKLTGGNFLGKSLVVAQFVLTVVLVTGMLTLHLQLDFLRNRYLGYDHKELLKIELPVKKAESVSDLLLQELRAYPEIKAVAGSSGSFNSGYSEFVQLKNGTQVNAMGAGIDAHFMGTMHIKLAAGRSYSQSFPADLQEGILINETLARQLGLQDAVGQKVLLASVGQESRIIGVMKDFNYWTLQVPVSPLFYFYQPAAQRELWVRFHPGNPARVKQLIETAFKKVVPDYPFTCAFQEEVNARQYDREARWRQIVTYASVFAVFISCIGLFGLATLAIGQRLKEVGIRKTLGASRIELITVLSRGFVSLVLLSFVISVPLGYYTADQWLQNFTYRIELTWWILIVPCLLIMLTAGISIIGQVLLAMQIRPVEILKNE
jgi:putative ABC transport system permease protein